MSGEKPGTREAMDRFTKRLVDHGVKPSKAREEAKASALSVTEGKRRFYIRGGSNK